MSDRISILYPEEQLRVTPAEPAAREPTIEEAPTALSSPNGGDNLGYEEPSKPTNPYVDKTNDRAATLYADTQTMHLSQDTDLSVLAQSPEEEASLSESLGFIGNCCGMEQSDLTGFVDIANRHAIGGPTGQSQQETLSSLYEKHGPETHQLLKDSQDLIRSFSDLHRYVEESGLGNEMSFIESVFRAVQTPRSQARLAQLRKAK